MKSENYVENLPEIGNGRVQAVIISIVSVIVFLFALIVAGRIPEFMVEQAYIRVGISTPFQRTTVESMKFTPVTVKVRLVEPACTEAGLRVTISGTGLGTTAFTVNNCEFEIPPPGVGFVTVIVASPEVCRSVSGIAACNSVADI